jgi:hypothetical protein
MMNGITGLTDDLDDLESFSLPVLGYLAKGAPKGDNVGRDLDYFRLKTKLPEVQQAFEQHYGQKPTVIRGYLAFSTIAENFQSTMKSQKGKTVHKLCNGSQIYLWRTPEGSYSRESKPCIASGKKCRDCKPALQLSIVVKELLDDDIVGALISTSTSWEDAKRLKKNLQSLVKLSQQARVGLHQIPIVLRRSPGPVKRKMDDGKVVDMVKSLLSLEPSAEWMRGYFGGKFGGGSFPISGNEIPEPAAEAEDVPIKGVYGFDSVDDDEDDSELIDIDGRDEMMRLIDDALDRLGWPTSRAKQELKNRFNTTTRKNLNDTQLYEFLAYLEQTEAALSGDPEAGF